MRAYIARTPECQELLKRVEIDNGCEFNQEEWMLESEESFHGEIQDNEFVFMDARLPDFSLPLYYVKLDH